MTIVSFTSGMHIEPDAERSERLKEWRNQVRPEINEMCKSLGIKAKLMGNMGFDEYAAEQDRILHALLTRLLESK